MGFRIHVDCRGPVIVQHIFLANLQVDICILRAAAKKFVGNGQQNPRSIRLSPHRSGE